MKRLQYSVLTNNYTLIIRKSMINDLSTQQFRDYI